MSHQSYKNLFQAGSIGNRTLANRFVSQTMEGNDGCMIYNKYYKELWKKTKS